MKRLINYILLPCILIVSIAGCSTQPSVISSSITSSSVPSSSLYKINFTEMQGNVPNTTFELAILQPDLPVDLKVYRMVKPEITPEYVAALAAKFGLTGEINEGEGGFSIHDKYSDAILDVYKPTGTILYSNDSKLYPKEAPVLPSDDEAKKIAMDFLNGRGLLPEGDVASTVSVGGTSGGFTAHLLVGFTHAIDITGPGAKHGVRIGDGGEVINVFINPTNPLNLPVQEIVTAKSLEQSYQELQNNRKYTMPADTRKVKISNVSVSYWLEPIDKGQEYVVPIYVFHGQCFDYANNQLKGNFTGYIQAVN